jgi:hypothetical protein
MSPITARATEISVLRYHAQQLQIQLSRLAEGLRLANINPEEYCFYTNLVVELREIHSHIGYLLGRGALVVADQYDDSRGLTP